LEDYKPDYASKTRLIVELAAVFVSAAALLLLGFFLFGWPTTANNIAIFLFSLFLVCIKLAFDYWKRKSKRPENDKADGCM
jgi:hypothetical protein